jgi:methionyl-tRNA formyltransferase
MDAGEIISQSSLKVEDADTAVSLRERLSLLAAQLLIETLEFIKSNKLSLIIQDETKVSSAPKLKKSDGLINWNNESIRIHNRVRGLLPWPGSFTYLKGKILKIHQTEILPFKKPSSYPGEITQILPDAIVVATKDASIKIKEIQVESGNKLTPKEFISGYRIKAGDKLG